MVIAVDPGEHVGCAVWTVLQGRLALHEHTHEGFLAWLRSMPHGGHVVCEEFRLFPHAAQPLIGDAFITVQVIGALRLWAGDGHMVFQPASLKLALNDMEMARLCHLSVQALRKRVKSRHVRDALRHMLIYYLRQGDDATVQAIAQAVSEL